MTSGEPTPGLDLPTDARQKPRSRFGWRLAPGRASLDAVLVMFVVGLEFLLQHLAPMFRPFVTGVLVLLLVRAATRVSRWRAAGRQVMEANATISADNLPPTMITNLADELSRWVRRRLNEEFRSGVLTRMVQQAIDRAVPPTVRLDATLHMAPGASTDARTRSPGIRPAVGPLHQAHLPVSLQLGDNFSGAERATSDGAALEVSVAVPGAPDQAVPPAGSSAEPSPSASPEPSEATGGETAHHPEVESVSRNDVAEEAAPAGAAPDVPSVAEELRSGLLTGAMALHFQPIFDNARRPCAVEALLRWQHPEWGTLMPGEFLPLARQADLLDAVTAYVSRRAIRDWQNVERAHPGLDLNLNGDLPTGLDERALDLMDALLRSQRIESRRVTWEFPAAQASAAPDAIREITVQLHQRGYKVGIDGWPVHLPPELAIQWGVDQIKVDCLGRPPRPLLSSLMQRAQRTGTLVAASGLEDETDIAMCIELGVLRLQGYAFGRPEPVDKVIESLRSPIPVAG